MLHPNSVLVEIDRDLHVALKIHAAITGQTLKAVVAEVLGRYLHENPLAAARAAFARGLIAEAGLSEGGN